MEHDTLTLDCSCGPAFFRPCDDCDPEDYRGAHYAHLMRPPEHAGCWKCVAGLIALTREEADECAQSDVCVVVVHR